MSVCRIVYCVVGKGCSLDKTLLTFALLRFVLQGQTCLLLQVSLDFLPLHSNPLWWSEHFFFFLVLVLEVLIGLHRTCQLQLLWHYWSGHRLGLLWRWMICLGNELRSFCRVLRLHPSTAFQTPLLNMRATLFFKGILAHSIRHNGHLN